MMNHVNLLSVLFSVMLYSCGEIITPSNNCGKCKSFAHDQPWYKCHWCNNKCVHMQNTCADVGNNICPSPYITKASTQTRL